MLTLFIAALVLVMLLKNRRTSAGTRAQRPESNFVRQPACQYPRCIYASHRRSTGGFA
jgi:hypothetical protein